MECMCVGHGPRVNWLVSIFLSNLVNLYIFKKACLPIVVLSENKPYPILILVCYCLKGVKAYFTSKIVFTLEAILLLSTVAMHVLHAYIINTLRIFKSHSFVYPQTHPPTPVFSILTTLKWNACV